MFGNVQQNFAVSNTALFEAAVKWWESKRPCGWTLERHLENPTANRSGAEKQLAKEIAKILILEMREGENDG